MDQAALLAELRALADRMPDFKTFTPTSHTHQQWLGKVQALIEHWKAVEGLSVRTQITLLGTTFGRDMGTAGIVGILHHAIADLELQLPAGADRAFGPGAVYDFFKALRDLLASAKQSILIIDPYLDEEVFDTYLAAVEPEVTVRLLARKNAAGLKAAIEKFITQTKKGVEARLSDAIHDRVIFLDDQSCWVVGQSIKNAAKTKPTYLAPLDTSTAELKRAEYDKIWNSAKPI
ncbi:MAG TPA: hypothetical protein VL155_20150 [Terriglobales bacterium]|jgi:hypothetical protein|nr:hypothetical protein [Terriglobales bacterium]